MKSIGIVRKVDPLGRIVLPIELRRSMDIEVNDPLEIYVEGDGIILKKYNPGCSICGNIHEDLKVFDGIAICKSCAKKISAAYHK